MRMSVLIFVLAAALAACGDDYGSNPPGGGHSTTITVSNNVFRPTPDTVPAGQVTFSWSNASNGHNVTWDSGPDVQTNSGTMTTGTYSPTLIVGTYHYHCSIHLNLGMTGTIVVQ